MTVNDQLRRSSQRIQEASREIHIPEPPVKEHRVMPMLIGVGLAAVAVIVFLVWINPIGQDPGPADQDPASVEDLAMVRTWVEGALAGQFDDIAELTYGEFGEPEALAQLAQTLNDYQLQYGEPGVNITPFEAAGTEFGFACLALDFGDFTVEGGMVVREWPDLGRRLWEFRTGMSGCGFGPPVTTTLPAPTALSDVWYHPSASIGRYSRASFDFLASGAQVAVLEGDDAQGLAVLDLDSGADLWRFDFPEQPGTILEFANGELVWATYVRVGVHSADGTLLWEHQFDDARWPTLAALDGGLLTVALDPTMEGDDRPPLVVQFDESGEIAWSTVLTGSNPDEDLQWTDLLIADDSILVQSTDAVYRLASATGAQEWRVPFAEAEIETFGPIGNVYSEGVAYVADPASEFSGREGGEVLGIDLRTGEIVLALDVGRGPRIVGVVEGRLVYADETGVFGVEIGSGDTWTAEIAEAFAAIDGGRVIVASPTIVAVLGPNGDQQLEATTDGGQPQQPPSLLDQTMIVPGWDGTRAIDLGSGQVVRQWPGQFYAPVYRLDEQRALLGVAGDGIYLVRNP